MGLCEGDDDPLPLPPLAAEEREAKLLLWLCVGELWYCGGIQESFTTFKFLIMIGKLRKNP